MSRPLESYSVEVLAEWIRVRGFSYFPEELEGIEKRMRELNLPVSMHSDVSVGTIKESASLSRLTRGFWETHHRILKAQRQQAGPKGQLISVGAGREPNT
jgi:hypothetical protein